MFATAKTLADRLRFLVSNWPQFKRYSALNPFSHTIESRKTTNRILIDVVLIYLRTGELSTLYFSQRLDLRNRKALREFLPYARFRQLRDRRNQPFTTERPFHYICLLRDKITFERYFGAAGLPVHPTAGSILPGLSAHFAEHGTADLVDLSCRIHERKEYFCKPRFGLKGQGVFRLALGAGEILVNGTRATRVELEKLIDTEYVCQELLVQDPSFGRFHPQSVNTLRIITFRKDSKIEIFSAYLRIGCAGQIADNNESTRASVSIDVQSGQFASTGLYIVDDIPSLTPFHPDTKVSFAGLVVPDYSHCVNIAIRAHQWTPSIQSIGWDFVLTPKGYVLLEGNDDWGSTIAMMHMPDFVPQFLSRVTI